MASGLSPRNTLGSSETKRSSCFIASLRTFFHASAGSASFNTVLSPAGSSRIGCTWLPCARSLGALGLYWEFAGSVGLWSSRAGAAAALLNSFIEFASRELPSLPTFRAGSSQSVVACLDQLCPRAEVYPQPKAVTTRQGWLSVVSCWLLDPT